MFHKALAKTPCASDLKEAEVVVIPGYTFSNCHWPHYGDNCSRAGSLFRQGKECNDLQGVKEYQQLQAQADFATKLLAIVDGSIKDLWLPDTSIYRDPGFLVSKACIFSKSS